MNSPVRSGLVGLVIFLGVVALGGGYEFLFTRDGALFAGPSEMVRVEGYVGSEKAGFLADPEVQALLADRYGIEVVTRRVGTFEMLDLPAESVDFMWPASELPLDRLRDAVGRPLESQVVFSSPVVLYSWVPVVDQLERRGLVTWDQGAYHAELDVLLQLIADDTTWSDLGVNGVFGRVTITSTDPRASNSGAMFAVLVANTLNDAVLTEAEVPAVLPDVRRVFRIQGQMEHSTGTLFERVLQQGMAQYPLVVGYENLYRELDASSSSLWDGVRDDLVMIYPSPTVWSSHPIVALTERGRRLMTALEDEDLLALAWERHGFRSRVDATGAISPVTQIPRPPVVFELLDGLSGADGGDR